MCETTIILPALNEADSIGSVIREIKTLPLDIDIIVADNGSTDRTAVIADSLGACVINVPERGKGNAVRAAINYLQSQYAFMLDADGTYPAIYLTDMVHLLKQDFDIVVGKRKTGSMRLYNRLCNLALSIPNYAIYGGKNPDICSGLWGFKTQVLKDLSLTAPDFTLEADITTQAFIKHYKLASVSIEYRKRLGGESKIKFKDGLKIASVLFRRSLK